MAVIISNNATSLLQSSITGASGTITVASGDASKFPSPTGGDWAPITIVDTLGNMEIMRCTARASNVLTVTRGQEGTSAQSFSAGSRVDHRFTAAAFAQIAADIATKADAAATAAALATKADDTATTAALAGKASTASVAAKADAANPQFTGNVRVNKTDPAEAQLDIEVDAATIPAIVTRNGAQVVIRRRRSNGTSGSKTAVVDGDTIAAEPWQGWNGSAWVGGLTWRAIVAGVPAAGVVPMKGTVTTTDAAGTQSVFEFGQDGKFRVGGRVVSDDATDAAAGLVPVSRAPALFRGSAGVVSITSGATTLDATHAGKLINFGGSSAFTCPITAAATLKDGWMAYFRATTAIVVTLDPNGSETIDGALTLTLGKGQEGLLVCDGSSFYTVGLVRRVQFPKVSFSAAAQSIATLPAGFDDYFFETSIQPDTLGSSIQYRLSNDGGATLISAASSYLKGYDVSSSNSGKTLGTQLDTAGELQPAAYNTDRPAVGSMIVRNARNGSVNTIVRSHLGGARQGFCDLQHQNGVLQRLMNEVNDAVGFYASSGNISGWYALTGVKY